MNTIENNTSAAEIFESYIPSSAPSNASPSRRGYGWSRKEAHAAAQHWNNQAPFAKTRKITVFNGSKNSDQLALAYRICGLPIVPTERDLAREKLIQNGQYADAVRDFLSER